MAFGKERTQPKDTNYCGGYALWAILADLGLEPNKEDTPKKLYDAVQKHQQAGLCKQSNDLIERMKRQGGNTAICLPSSLVKEALNREFEVSLYHSEGIAFEPEVIDDEESRCECKVNKCTATDDVLKVLDDENQHYYLVLVDDCHWIALKRKKKAENVNKLSVYDSAFDYDDKDARKKKFPDEYSNVGSLVIALRFPADK